ncbi:hypothetical protein FAIPA1_40125 [Frankia sp. AiPs1]|uniref:hypothetical protein n=1 Tax=Frankia sp. AiPa1 TaxID=573492 RepID=UPI00202AEF19|nr:hypothetical protein [Frankia sp. AiPa1]MCL9758306.1 hypothetical protein [Frankia sp. AiPa1]
MNRRRVREIVVLVRVRGTRGTALRGSARDADEQPPHSRHAMAAVPFSSSIDACAGYVTGRAR